ncbi:MAG: hypothetical protein LBB15_01420 [Puniceicoccales bacterium]|nr:hypothetical protein [Puniceicoccales bacterium]
MIQSNVKHTLNALDQVANVSAKEKLMAMQIMIDHDLGYTTDAAKGDFGAAKDHPLASTAYMELGGQASGVFTDDERKFMRDAVLKHSYPFGLDQPFNFPEGDDADAQKARQTAIAGVISVVDAMGVTGDTKCPAIFREVEFFDTLGTLVKLARDLKDGNIDTLRQSIQHDLGTAFLKKTNPEKLSQLDNELNAARNALKAVPNDTTAQARLNNAIAARNDAINEALWKASHNPGEGIDSPEVEAAREKLRKIETEDGRKALAGEIETETRKFMHEFIEAKMKSGAISPDVAEGYHMAVDYDMSAHGGGMILPQFGGKLLGTEMESVDGGHALHIHFGVSENIRNLATAFGGADVVDAFNKAAGDLFTLSRQEINSGKIQPDLKAEASAVESDGQERTFERGAIKLTMTKLENTPEHPDPLIHPDPTVVKSF